MGRCKLLLFWCLVVSLALGARSDDSGSDVRDVKTSQGTVRGHKNPDHGVYAFYSIPYATTPTGSQRFKAPLPGPAWLQPLDAVDKHIVCPQMFNPYISSKVMQEECLVASVYVPDTKDKKIPVVVYVHGGAFQIGFGDMIPPFSFVKIKGATHCAQTLHVMDGRKYMNPLDINESESYKRMQVILQDLWYNFITTGKPIPDDRVITSEGTALPEWPAVGANRSPHMSLGVEIELQTTLLQKRTEFWDGIYSKYYKVPVPPPTPPPRPHSEL